MTYGLAMTRLICTCFAGVVLVACGTGGIDTSGGATDSGAPPRIDASLDAHSHDGGSPKHDGGSGPRRDSGSDAHDAGMLVDAKEIQDVPRSYDAGSTLPSTCPAGTTCGACTVDVSQTVLPIDPHAVGSCISTYGDTVATSAPQRSALSQLSLGHYRIPIRWNDGNPVSSASGGPQNMSADEYVSAVLAMGAEPVIVIGGTTGDDDIVPSDAANLVSHYTAMGVTTFYVGNEPGNAGMTIDQYATLFNSCATAMRAANASIKIGGPTWAYYDLPTMQTFLEMSGANVDILDFHDYAMGNPPALTNDAALSGTDQWGTEVAALYTLLSQQGLTGRQVSVGEYNWAWQYDDGIDGGDPRFFQPIITVWAASVIGHVLTAGGWPFQYSDQNGPLGLTVQAGDDDQGMQQSAPQPIYYGLGMWTGESLFRGFGANVVSSSCTDGGVEIYATSGPDVLLINKTTAVQNVEVAWNVGDGHAVSVWQTNGTNAYAAPTKVASGAAPATSVYVALPALTVTALVVE
jgi:hypothetical protein